MMGKKTEYSYVHNNKERKTAKRGISLLKAKTTSSKARDSYSENGSIDLHNIKQPTQIFITLRMCFIT